jgi:hypothetical protein
MKLLVMQFPPISRHVIPPRSKYSPHLFSVTLRILYLFYPYVAAVAASSYRWDR